MLTLASCWYIFNSKFNLEIYKKWINNILLNVSNFRLVIFTNEKSKWMIEPYLKSSFNPNSKNIKMVIVEIEDFYGYQYKDRWIKNHTVNYNLNNKVDWEVNMLWSEKIFFVKKMVNNNYFSDNITTEWVGWCDIGYFRGEKNNILCSNIYKWPNKNKMLLLDKTKIYYAKVCNDNTFKNLKHLVLNKNVIGLPENPIPSKQYSIAGGFFLITSEKIDEWYKIYYSKLNDYFENNYLVKDDQMIILDCAMNNLSLFEFIKETNSMMDKWFAFSNYLL